MGFVGTNSYTNWIRIHWKLVLIHAGIWLFYILFNNSLLWFSGQAVSLRYQICTYSLYAGLFYLNVYGILRPLIPQKKYLLIILYTLLAIAGYVGLRYLLLRFVLPALGLESDNTLYYIMLPSFLPDSIWLASQGLMFSYGYWFALYLLDSERQRRKLAMEMVTLEREKSQAQLSFLRSQLNPHFLYNTLNFFFSDALKTSPRLAESILLLASMMRTVTQLGEKNLVSAEQELEYIDNYITLQRHRFGESMHLIYDVDGEDLARYTKIPPLLLITLVENVFKYADLDDANVPARIEAVITEDELMFQTTNKIKENPNYVQGGLGLSNVMNQLQILFKNKHFFERSEKDGIFFAKIRIFTS